MKEFEDMSITQVLDFARQIMGSTVDYIYARVDDGSMEPDEGFRRMIDEGVEEEAAFIIIEHASGIPVEELKVMYEEI